MTPADQPHTEKADWDARRAASRRLGWIFGGLAFALFLIALWKYRPI